MTITQLKYVIAVANNKNFGLAAEKCEVSQPTLSLQIQKLEEELGVKLFDRKKQPVALTNEGQAIVAQANIVLEECEKIIEITQEVKRSDSFIIIRRDIS